MTDIPFPIGEDCCTRFATRIVSRRTAPDTPNKIVISIEAPNFKATQFDYPKNDAYMKFRKEQQSLTASEFASIIDEVRILSISSGTFFTDGSRLLRNT